jgi:hypothetical protein
MGNWLVKQKMARWFVAVSLVAIGCGGPTVPAAGSDAPLQTSDLTYQLRDDGRGGLTTGIPFTYHNDTGRTVYLVNCGGDVPPSLEKWVDSRWVAAWSPILLMCLSPPIVIAPGDDFEYTLAVYAARHGSNAFPQFEVAEPQGTYRLVWHAPRHDYYSDAPSPLPLDDRVSNTFELRMP